jgi:drug/metabolite transporter (DMT)-like permease
VSKRFAPAAGGRADEGPRGGLDGASLGLYAVVLFGWGTSWIAIPAQLGVVAPEVSVLYRFAIAAALMFVWMSLSGRPMRFPVGAHLRFALLGMLTFSTNFAIFYYAGFALNSGLMSVVFATATVFNILFSRLLFGDPVSGRTLLAAAMGLGGLCLVFLPAILGQEFGRATALALAAALAGTTLFSLGNMLSRANQARGLPVLQANAWGMAYGAIWLAIVVLVLGRDLAWDHRPTYVAALLFHIVFSTILAFGAYMTLLGRIGPQRAGYATVMFPIVALAISTIFEDHQWSASGLVGVALVLGGNAALLAAPRPRPESLKP